MARETRAAALTRVSDEIKPEEAGRELYVLLASSLNPDGSDFRLRIEEAFLGDSVIGAGVATAPGAGATIASIASGSLPAGKYRIAVFAHVSGNAVGDLNNLKLQRGGVDLAGIMPQGANGQSGPALELPRVNLDGTQALTVVAIGAGTAAIEYGATIVATRIE
jgi:hypothetical protein